MMQFDPQLRYARLISWMSLSLLCVGAPRLHANDLQLHRTSSVHFATAAEGTAILGARDRFIAAMSPFDRQSRLETDRQVSEEELLRFITAQAQSWEPDQVAKLTGIIDKLRGKLATFRLPFPATVVLVRTTGREEGQAAYCRKNAIVLPTSKLNQPDLALERLLTHELFHILSSHNPEWRKSMYKIIGFNPCPSVELPSSLKNRKLTNPDAPDLDAYISLNVDGESLAAVPVLFSKSEKFDPELGGPFFRYLVFRLMVVHKVDQQWVASEVNGEPRLLAPEKISDYSRQIGRNTSYIVHPDEILADNFVHLIFESASLPSPEIVEQMRGLLQAEGK